MPYRFATPARIAAASTSTPARMLPPNSAIVSARRKPYRASSASGVSSGTSTRAAEFRQTVDRRALRGPFTLLHCALNLLIRLHEGASAGLAGSTEAHPSVQCTAAPAFRRFKIFPTEPHTRSVNALRSAKGPPIPLSRDLQDGAHVPTHPRTLCRA